MNHPLMLRVVILTASIFAPRASAEPANTMPPAAGDKRPNILLVMADDQGYGDCGFTGHPFVQDAEPRRDGPARRRLQPLLCRRPGLFAHPRQRVDRTPPVPLPMCPTTGITCAPTKLTIAEALKDAGYVTAHFGKWHIGSVQPDSPDQPRRRGF